MLDGSPRGSPIPGFLSLSSSSSPPPCVYVYVLRKKNIKKELLTTAGGGDKLEEGIPGSMECTSRGWEDGSRHLTQIKGHLGINRRIGVVSGLIGDTGPANPGSTKCIPRDSSSASLSPLAPRAPNSARGRAKKKPRPGEGLGGLSTPGSVF